MSVITGEQFSVHIVWGEDENTGDFFWKMIHLIIGYSFAQTDGGIRILASSKGSKNMRTFLVEDGAYDAVGESYYVVTQAYEKHFVIQAFDTMQNAALSFVESARIEC